MKNIASRGRGYKLFLSETIKANTGNEYSNLCSSMCGMPKLIGD
jgi:hypothetical protein